MRPLIWCLGFVLILYQDFDGKKAGDIYAHPIMSSSQMRARTRRVGFAAWPRSGSAQNARQHCARLGSFLSRRCIDKCLRALALQPVAHDMRGQFG